MDPNIPATPPPPQSPPLPPSPPAQAPVAPTQPVYVERKSPGLAGFLSVFPGLGHLYVGAYQRALQVFGGLIASIFLTVIIGGAGAAFIVFTWFFGIVDSVRLARAINRGRSDQSALSLEERLPANGTGVLTIGVILIGLGSLWWADNTFNIDWSFMHRWGGPVAFVLLGLVLVVGHTVKKRKEHQDGIGMPPRSYLNKS